MMKRGDTKNTYSVLEAGEVLSDDFARTERAEGLL